MQHGRQAEKDKDRERERVEKKEQVRVRWARRSNSWDKQRLAVKHAAAKHRAVEEKTQ